MQFIKTLFWVVLAVVLVVFAANNWSPVSVLIWPDVRADAKLPVLIIGAFLLGFVPTYAIYRTALWRLRRRIKSLEQANAQHFAAPAPATTPTPVHEIEAENTPKLVESPAVESETEPTDAVGEAHAGGPRL